MTGDLLSLRATVQRWCTGTSVRTRGHAEGDRYSLQKMTPRNKMYWFLRSCLKEYQLKVISFGEVLRERNHLTILKPFICHLQQ